jgi:hypothetical protein
VEVEELREPMIVGYIANCSYQVLAVACFEKAGAFFEQGCIVWRQGAAGEHAITGSVDELNDFIE